MGYTYQGEDDKSFQLLDQNSSPLLVAKNGMDPDTLSFIQNLPKAAPNASEPSPLQGKLFAELSQPGLGDRPGITPNFSQDQIQAEAANRAQTLEQSRAKAEEDYQRSLMQQQASLRDMGGAPPPGQLGEEPLSPSRSPEIGGGSVSSPPPPASSKIEPSQVALAAPTPTSNAINPMLSGDYLNKFEGAHQQELRGIQGMAQADVRAAEAKRGAYQNLTSQLEANQKSAETLNAKMQAYQEASLKHLDEMNQNLNRQSEINPNRVWDNMSTAQRITTGIALALGSLGSSLQGNNNNPALEVINKAIERDIDAQKANYLQKSNQVNQATNLYAQNLKAYGDQRMALDATRANYIQLVQTQIAQAEAQSGGARASANAQYLKGQLNSQYEQTKMSLGMALQKNAATQHLMSGGAIQNPAFLDEKLQARLVKMPDNTYRLAGSEKGKEEVDKITISGNEMLHTLDEMKKLQAVAGPSTPYSTYSKQAQALMSRIMFQNQQLEGINRLSEPDIKLLEHQIADPTAFRQGVATHLMDQMRDHIGSKINSVYSQHVMGYRPIHTQAPQTTLGMK